MKNQIPLLVCQLKYTLQGHKDEIFGLAWSSDGNIIASGAKDNSIYLWDANTGELIRKLQHHAGTVLCVAFSPDGQLLASGSVDNNIVSAR